ncbi:MAG TPA: Re/Si-specific NAD(P)(+) transhydrogenase subunit alpha, partial [Kofleriaceae bacterium]|nr:Re/Si-specific NAD(P)(+) transhydrogenase subunit alpha [Kofleriaceae bacterium]
MKLGVLKESQAGEKRVALTPSHVKMLLTRGFSVLVEAGSGDAAGYPDTEYAGAGATVLGAAAQVSAQADILLKVRPPTDAEVDRLRDGQTLISFFWPAQNQALLARAAGRGASLLAMDQIPRITRAQKEDALSSMANIAGYRAVIEAANAFGSFFTGQITAAGKVQPAKVLVIGAGVAGLAAMGAARGLGAVVRAFDTRAAVKDQVRSMGGEFLEVQIQESGDGGGGYAREMSPEFIAAEMALFAQQAVEVDIVITTALIPGKPAPKLWLAEHVKLMKPGSVVVDLAAEQGGNCEATVPGKSVVVSGVTVIGWTDMASRMAHVASELYGNNLLHLLADMGNGAGYKIDLDDEVVRGALITHQGKVTWPPPKKEAAPPPKPQLVKEVQTPPPAAAAEPVREPAPPKPPAAAGASQWLLALIGVALAGGWMYLRVGVDAQDFGYETMRLLQQLTVFVLAVFVGWQVIWNVTPALHTPLMSVTNAISGIIILGGLLQQGSHSSASVIIGGVATLFAAINVAG